MYDKFIKNAILLAENKEYFSRKCEKSYFSTKYTISAQNRIRPWDVSGFVRLFFILSKNMIFPDFPKNIVIF